MQIDVKQGAPLEKEAINTEAPKEEVVTTSPVVNEKPKGKGLVTVLVILGVLALLGAAAYASYYFANSEPANEEESSFDTPGQEEGEEGQNDEEESAVPVSSEFIGDYVTAEVPDGWSIVEYVDGAGSDMLVGQTDYQGLTGLSVLTDEDEEVLKVYAVMGIGGIDICSTVAQFSDTPQTYINVINGLTTDYNLNSDPDEVMPVVNVISDEEYTAFSFIDFRGRRVDTDLYWNDLDNADINEFHPLCGLSAGVLFFETLSFEYDSGMGFDTGNSYSVKIMGDPSEDTLLLLDDVMSSITLN